MIQASTTLSCHLRGRLAGLVLALAGLAAAVGCSTAPAGRNPVGPEVRNEAARRGLSWLAGYLVDDTNAGFLGWDAVHIGLEPSITSMDPGLRDLGRSLARRQARRLAASLLDTITPLDHDEALDLLRLTMEAERLDLDPAPLRAKVREVFRALDEPDEILGFEPLDAADIADASTLDVFDLLLTTYWVERARLLGEWPGGRFRLADLLPLLASRELPSPDEDREEYEDHIYLVTHVAYVLNDYGQIRLPWKGAPWIREQLERVFAEVLASADVELVAEIVDVLRGVDDEAARAIVDQGTRFLLDAQNPDGSWGRWEDEPDPYRVMHATWCATTALRERRVLTGTPWERHVRGILRP